MEMSQGYSQYSQLKKHCHFFSFTQLENRRTGPVCVGLVPVEGEEVGKRCGRVYIVQILYAHVCKLKNDTCRNCSRNG
jgi:hypothetical protein